MNRLNTYLFNVETTMEVKAESLEIAREVIDGTSWRLRETRQRERDVLLVAIYDGEGREINEDGDLIHPETLL